jgi:hypothetical protein
MSQKNTEGLFVRGQVIARKRKEVTQGGKKRLRVTPFTRSGAQVQQADRWSDDPLPEGTPSVGRNVELPVWLGAYVAHGMAVARLSWGGAAAGSDF